MRRDGKILDYEFLIADRVNDAMLPCYGAPGHGESHYGVVVLAAWCAVAGQSRRQPLSLIRNQLTDQYRIVQNPDVPALESQSQSFYGSCFTSVRGCERLNPQPI